MFLDGDDHVAATLTLIFVTCVGMFFLPEQLDFWLACLFGSPFGAVFVACKDPLTSEDGSEYD